MRLLLFFGIVILGSSANAQDCKKLIDQYDMQLTDSKISDSERRTSLMQRLKDCKEYEVGIWQRYGTIYNNQKQYDSALFYYYRALSLIEAGKKYSYLNSVLKNIGNIYSMIGQFDDALKYYNMDTILRLKYSNNSEISEYYFNRSFIHGKNGQFSLAEYDWSMAYLFLEDKNDLNELSGLGILKCEVYREKRDFKSALNAIKKIAKYRYADIYDDYKLWIFNHYSYCMSKVSTDKTCKILMDTAIIFARKTNNMENLTNVLFDASYVYASSGDSAIAYACLLEGKLLNDRTQTEKINLGIQKNDYSIQHDLNSKNLELTKSELKNKNIILFFSILGLIILGIMFIVGVLYMRQSRRINLQRNKIELLEAQITERRRIAMDIHDNISNDWLGIKLKLDNILMTEDLLKAEDSRIQDIKFMFNKVFDNIRSISHDLHSKSWMFELKSKFKDIMEECSLKIELLENNVNISAFPEIEKEISHITEELINNSIKHSKATNITIQFNIINDTLLFTYEEDGIGFNSSNIIKSKGLGLRNIKTRVSKLGAKMDFDTAPGKGLFVFISIPVTNEN